MRCILASMVHFGHFSISVFLPLFFIAEVWRQSFIWIVCLLHAYQHLFYMDDLGCSDCLKHLYLKKCPAITQAMGRNSSKILPVVARSFQLMLFSFSCCSYGKGHASSHTGTLYGPEHFLSSHLSFFLSMAQQGKEGGKGPLKG